MSSRPGGRPGSGPSRPQAPGPGRPAPHLPPYLVSGAVLGFLVGAGLAIFGAETPMSSILQQVVLLGVLFAALGVLLGAVVYLVVDWRHEHPTLR